MPRPFEPRTEEEARRELERRHHPRERGDSGAWVNQFGYGPGAMIGAGYGWPFLPPPYPYAEYGPYASPPAPEPRQGRVAHSDERGFMDRAGDEVASWFGDEAAEARREADHRGRGPKNYVRPDPRIEEDVNDRLTDDPFVDATEIAVSIKDREVTLDGTVDSRRAKRRAEDCADSVSGVVHVQNNLRVSPAP